MACFLMPMIIVVLTSLFRKRIPSVLMINVLNFLLWGGVLGLAFEHIVHGEVVLYPPFLTAGLDQTVFEMVTIGIPMTLSVVGVWGFIVLGINGPFVNLIKIRKLKIASVLRVQG
ncbi:MAG: hypothetical protein RMI79_05575 [Nitrososphaerota archaeon]|nr:hypothetical protein [Nitrososphaerota archaeon]